MPLKPTAVTKQTAAPAYFGAGHEYDFHIEGLNRDVCVVAGNRAEAHWALWQSLKDFERDAVVQIECIDEREAE